MAQVLLKQPTSSLILSSSIGSKGPTSRLPHLQLFLRPWRAREPPSVDNSLPIAVEQFQGAPRHNKRSSTVDVTKMNCYIVLTNEGRPLGPTPSPSLLPGPSRWRMVDDVFLVCLCASSYYVSGPSLLESPSPSVSPLFTLPFSLSLSLSTPSLCLLVVVRSAPRLVLRSAREARVLPVPIVSCMINGSQNPSRRLGTASRTHVPPFQIFDPSIGR